jgi:hypothetical protein
MRNHPQLKKFFAATLITLGTLAAMTEPAQGMGAAQSSQLATNMLAPRDESKRSWPPPPLQAPYHDATAKRQVGSSPGGLRFRPVVNYDSGGKLDYSFAVGDLNGDGKPDVVAANCSAVTFFCGPTRGILGVLLGNGDGTLGATLVYDSGGYGANYVAIADVNGDGKPDLLAANVCAIGHAPCNGSVAVLFGNGDGTFQGAATYDSGDYDAEAVTVADLNGDGKPDLLVVNCCSVAALLGNGDGTFQTAVTYPFSGSYIYSFAVADVNGDGKLDIFVLVQNLGSNSISMFLGNGDGTFGLPVTLLPDFAVWSVALADVNGDGKPDLLMTNLQINVGEVGVALGDGDGTFQSAVTFGSGGAAPRSVAVGDFNGDGKADLAVANSGSGQPNTNNIAVLLGKGDGSFLTATSYAPGGDGTWAVTVADLNGDGKPDILLTNANGTGSSDGFVGVLLNKATTITSLTSSLNPSTYGQKVTWTATVTSSSPITPTGKVNFTSDGVGIGTAVLNASGVATFSKRYLNASAFPVIAVYTGDTSNLRSASNIVNQVVRQATSTATISSSPNPSIHGQAVTFTAEITSPTVTASGPVTFAVGKTVLGTAQLSGGKARLTISSLAVGSTKVTATYYGDSNIAKSSASVIQKVQ